MSPRPPETLPVTTDVLVVGAGPVGLTLGCALASLGVDFAVLDRLPRPLGRSRSAAVQARTLETLGLVGAADELVSRGLPAYATSLYDGDRRLLSVPYGELDTPFPFVLTVPQDVTERVLADRLGALGGSVHRECVLLDVYERGGRATAVVADGDGEVRAVHANYIVGCDGIASGVRAAAGIPFPGQDRPETFTLAEVDMDWSGPRDEVPFFLSPYGLLLVTALPDGRFRVAARVADDTPPPEPDDVQQLLDQRAPASARPQVHAVSTASRWRVQHRIADRFGAGRVFLAGDAAHVHSPVGGQGMNAGIQDAVNLAWKLAAVLGGSAGGALLDSYERERRPIATGLLRLTGMLTDIADVTDPVRREIRDDLLVAVDGLPQAVGHLAGRLAQLGVAYPPPEGTASGLDGRPDGIRPADGARVVPDADARLAWSLHVPPGTAPVEPDGDAPPVAVVPREGLTEAVLVRPDGHTALVAPPAAAGALLDRLPAWLRDGGRLDGEVSRPAA